MRKPRNKLRQITAKILLGVFLFASAAPALVIAPQPVHAEPAGFDTDGECSEISDPDRYYQCVQGLGTTQKEMIKSLRNANDARKFFRIQGQNGDDESTDFQWRDDFKMRTERGHETLARYRKFEGNPWLVWSNKHGNIGPVEQPGGKEVRFVLSEAIIKKSSDWDELNFKVQGIIYVFRSEYNPSLAVLHWKRGGVQDDPNRLTWTSGCENPSGVDDKDAKVYISKAQIGGDGPGLPDSPNDEEELDKALEENNLQDENCEGSQGDGLFEKAIKAALGKVKEGMIGLLKTFGRWLEDLMDVGALTSNAGLTNAWKTIRDLVNVTFILALIAIAFSNILRIDTDRYGARALLPRLVFAVIAVNFSFLLVQLLVNLASILASPFKNGAIGIITNPPTNGGLLDPDGGFGKFIVAFIVVLAIVVALAILLIFFLARVVMVWLLAALSPLVFLFMVLPATRSMARSWMTNTLKWVFMAPIAFMILYIAASIVTGRPDRDPDLGDINFILRVGFFVGAAIAAVVIPLKLGGEVMQRVAGGAKRGSRLGRSGAAAGLGLAAKQTGVAAAWEQQKAKAENKQAVRGARLRKNIGDRVGGRYGTEMSQQATAQLHAAKEKRAEEYAGQFGAADLRDMAADPRLSDDQRETLDLAHQMRTGYFQAKKSSDQAGWAGFHQLYDSDNNDDSLQRQRLGNLTNRSVKEFSPEVLGELATSKDPKYEGMLHEQFHSDAASGILEQNHRGRVDALVAAHRNGRLSPEVYRGIESDQKTADRFNKAVEERRGKTLSFQDFDEHGNAKMDEAGEPKTHSVAPHSLRDEIRLKGSSKPEPSGARASSEATSASSPPSASSASSSSDEPKRIILPGDEDFDPPGSGTRS